MNEARRARMAMAGRLGGLLLAWASLAGLWILSKRVEGVGFEFAPGKNRFQQAARKKVNLSDVHKANLLPVGSPVVINEIGLASPLGPLDEAGNPADWIELYNKSGRPVSLKGCTLTDSLARTRKWILPDIEMAPRSHLMVWADGESRMSSSLDVAVKDPGDWTQERDDFETQSGYTWYGSNSVPPEKRDVPAGEMRADFVIREPGKYSLWLRVHNKGKKPAALRCRIDGEKKFPVAVTGSRGYAMIRLYNPRDRRGYWPFDAREHNLWIALERGVVVLDRIVLTRSDASCEMVDPSVHAGFRLNNAGELVAFYSAQGIPLDYVDFPALPPGRTYSRVPAGADRWQLADPTPMGMSMAWPPRFSMETGYLDQPARLAVSAAGPEDVVRYTLDGSKPTPESPVFPDGLTITQKCIVRARSFRPGAVPSAIETRMFWLGPRPEVPVLWLAMDPDNLWGRQRGIMLNYMARGVNSERPCYAALFEPDGRVASTVTGLRNQGRGSRIRSPVRSFRITCRARYGHERWPGAVFEGDGPDRPTSFLLRAKGLVVHPMGMEMMRAAGFLAPRTRHCLVYMNHQPYGIYFLLEDVEQPEFMLHHFGHLDLDVIKRRTLAHPVLYGTSDEFDRTWPDLAKGGARHGQIEAVDRVFDREYFTRWIASAVYLDSGDNDQSLFVFNRRAPAPAWSLINWDFDGAFYYSFIGQTNTVRDAANVQGFLRQIFRGLMNDPGYAGLYLSELQRLMNHPFRPGRWLRRLSEYEALLQRYADVEHQGELNQNRQGPRWHLFKRLTEDDTRRELQERVDLMRRFFETRDGEVRRRLREEYALPEAVPVEVESEGAVPGLIIDGWDEPLPYKGLYFPGTPLTLAALDPSVPLVVNGEAMAIGSFQTNIVAPLSIRVGR